MKTHTTGLSLALLTACLWLAGCSTPSDSSKARWHIETVEYTCGTTNYSLLYKQPVLLDTRTGRTWALNSDPTNGCYVWLPFVFRSRSDLPVTP